MEFFAEVQLASASAIPSPDQLYDLVTIARLPELCASIDSIVSVQSPRAGEIYCVWGQFQVSRERIRNGVRLALLNCPHALAWTIATKPEDGGVVIHCTIDDKVAESEFIETIEQFVDDWAQGLKIALAQPTSEDSVS
jgi:hypothetical protein